LAVGMTENTTSLAERLSGSTWSVGALPASTTSFGSGVSCVAAGKCFATANVNNARGEYGLVYEWSGTSWNKRFPAFLGPKEATSSYVDGISCTSSSECTAVGSYTGGSGAKPLIERLGLGSEKELVWKIEEGANGADEAVSCASSIACMAVGLGLSQSWNGKEWKAGTLAVPAEGEKLGATGVSCTAANECTAVGYYFPKGSAKNLAFAERWNGKEWSIQTLPTPKGAETTLLDGVSCTSATSCTAVGGDSEGGHSHAIAVTWNGTEWLLHTVAKPAEEKSSTLLSVSCLSSKACTAVGRYEGSGQDPLAEAWNGTEWLVQTTPGVGNLAELKAVSCVSTTECLAVGMTENTTSLAERYS
jgi:hypothetical protein